MIVEYHRPFRMETALQLLNRDDPRTIPLAGGTWLNRKKGEDIAVIDIQDLMLDDITSDGDVLHIGAKATLQQICDSELVENGLRKAAHREASYNLRQMATIGGTIAVGGGTSFLLTALLAANAQIVFAEEPDPISLQRVLSNRAEFLYKRLITAVQVPAFSIVWEEVARTPNAVPDLICCVGAASTAEVRVALGGTGATPVLLRSTDLHASLAAVVANSSEYIQSIAMVLLERCLSQVESEGTDEH